jgi:DNA-binding NarL/FixJ family response regulator
MAAVDRMREGWEMVKVAIINDHRLMRIGIEQVLARCSGVRVVASVPRADELDLAEDRPDVVILDPSPYPVEASFRMIQAIAAVSRVLIVSMSSDRVDPTAALAAVRAGAYGVITREADDDELFMAVAAVAAGALYLSAGLAPHLRAELGRQPGMESRGLAPREVETLRWLARGYTHGQIARRMGLTEATVSSYVKRIRAKLNVGNKAELTRRAMEMGCLSTEPGTGPREMIGSRAWSAGYTSLAVVAGEPA